MTCSVCDGYTDDLPRSQATDALRAQRLARAVLTGDEAGMQRVLDEIGDCRDCLGRQVMVGVGGYAQMLVDKFGVEGALNAVEAGLAQDILGDDEPGPPKDHI